MKILLNCLPPADVNTPSISLSILKAFMQNQGFETEVKYWNALWPDMGEYIESEDTEIRLLPYLSMLNDAEDNTKGQTRILSLLQQLQPSFKANDPEYYSEFLEEQKEEIYQLMDAELEAIDWSEILLFGITAKYNQWIPGMLLAEAIKGIAPNVKIVVGGFGNEKVAQEAMKLCPSFDFATWGEGEYALLALSEQLSQDEANFDTVPRLFYREAEELIQSSINKSEYLDFEDYIYPDFEDFVALQSNGEEDHEEHEEEEENDKINIPINTIRSCHWRKCQFCDFNKGYKLRMRSAECIVKEIEHINLTYGYTTFSFVDSDTFGNLQHFEQLLDLLIDLKFKNEEDLIFWAEIIPNASFTKGLMEKMAIAGFKNIFIGYDALTDTLLQKMNKSNSFSDNIFFVKQSLKHGISPFVNVIKHVPGETEEDVQESIDNLHFLRFFYNNSIVSFSHNYVPLVLSSMTKYYKELTELERNAFNKDDLSYLMPDYFSEGENRFHLFRFEHEAPSNNREWEKLIEIEDYYKTNTFNYRIQENQGIFYFTEYCNDEEIANIVFGEPEYGLILKACQQKVLSLSELLSDLIIEFPELTEARLKEILSNLKSSYLLYCNSDFSNIISIVEV